MKQKKQLPLAASVTWVLSTVLITLAAACAGNGQSSQTGNTTDSTRTKAPLTDIHTAVINGDEEAVRAHIAGGTDLNSKEPFGGSSPLISAAVFGKANMVHLLIDAGADLNSKNNDGSTALISAAFFGRPEIVKQLLDAGADKTIRNKYGATAYESVIVPFKDIKPSYDMMGKVLEPMGLKLDYAYLEKVRPEIAEMLK